MLNESSGKDFQIMCRSLLWQVTPSWRNLRHKVSTIHHTISPAVLLFFLSHGHNSFFSINTGHIVYNVLRCCAII